MKRFYRSGGLFSIICISLLFTSCPALSNVASTSTTTTIATTASGEIHLKGVIPPTTLKSLGATTKDTLTATQLVCGFGIIEASLQGDYTPAVQAAVEKDGSFTLPIEESTIDADNYILLITNPNAEKLRDRVTAVLAIENGTYRMIEMPTSEALNDIDFGQLIQDGDEALSNIDITNQAVFNLPDDKLLEISKIDDVFKDAKNRYINGSMYPEKYFKTHLIFGLTMQDMSSFNNTWTDPEKNIYTGYGLYFDDIRVKEQAELDEILHGKKLMTITFPSEIKIEGLLRSSITNSDMKLTQSLSDGSEWWGNDQGLSICGKPNSGNNHIELRIQNTDTSGSAQGWWTITVDDKIIAEFDTSSLTPFDGDGKIKYYIPSIKIETNSTDTVTKILIRWYQYDASSGTLKLIPDDTIFNRIITNLGLELCDWSGTTDSNNSRISEIIDHATNEITKFSREWKYFGNSSTTNAVLEDLGLGINFGSSSIRYDFRIAGY